jgi:hypothetical protein
LRDTDLGQETTYDVDDAATETTLDTVPTATAAVDVEEESGAESEASAGAGSTGALDRTDEDFTREQARATGFMGKNSDVTWLQRLREQTKYNEMQDQQGNKL